MNRDVLLKVLKAIEPTVEFHDVQKGNRVLTGVMIGNSSIRPTVYVENFEDMFYKSGYFAVATEIIETLKANEWKGNLDIEKITSWDYVKDKLMLCIAKQNVNPGCVTIPYLDLDLYFRVDLNHGTFKVTEQMLNMWGVTPETLLENANKIEYELIPLKDLMAELMGVPNVEGFDSDILVITNNQRLYGASALYYTDILYMIADDYDSDLYIIPSSVHEIMVLPVNHSGSMNANELKDLINMANADCVEEEDQLSNHPYIYDKSFKQIYYRT